MFCKSPKLFQPITSQGPGPLVLPRLRSPPLSPEFACSRVLLLLLGSSSTISIFVLWTSAHLVGWPRRCGCTSFYLLSATWSFSFSFWSGRKYLGANTFTSLWKTVSEGVQVINMPVHHQPYRLTSVSYLGRVVELCYTVLTPQYAGFRSAEQILNKLWNN